MGEVSCVVFGKRPVPGGQGVECGYRIFKLADAADSTDLFSVLIREAWIRGQDLFFRTADQGNALKGGCLRPRRSTLFRGFRNAMSPGHGFPASMRRLHASVPEACTVCRHRAPRYPPMRVYPSLIPSCEGYAIRSAGGDRRMIAGAATFAAGVRAGSGNARGISAIRRPERRGACYPRAAVQA